MNKWYRSGYRRNLGDMHIDAWDPVFLSRFDPEVYLKCLQEARIQNPMIYTHSHVGYCNFPTRTGEMHPGFRGEDKIGRLFRLCRENGMAPVAYYSLIYNNRVYERFPSFRMLESLPNRPYGRRQ